MTFTNRQIDMKKQSIKQKQSEISISKPVINSMLMPRSSIGDTLASLTGFENRVLLGFLETIYGLFRDGIMDAYDGYFNELAGEKRREFMAQEAARKSCAPIPIKATTISFFVSANSFVRFAFKTLHGVNSEQKKSVLDTVSKLAKSEYVMPYKTSKHECVMQVIETILIANITEKTNENSILRVSIGDGLMFGMWKTAKGRNAYRISADALHIAQNSNSRITCVVFAWITRNRYNLERRVPLSFQSCLDAIISETDDNNSQNIRKLKQRLCDEIEAFCRKSTNRDVKINRKELVISVL